MARPRTPNRLSVWFALTAILLTLSAPVPAESADAPAGTSSLPIFDVRITHRLPSGWKVGHEQQNDRALIREYVPAGQSVHDWREMITLQAFRNLALNPQATPKDFLGRLAGLMRQSCPGNAVIQPLGIQQIGTLNGETAILGCRRMDRDHVSGAQRGQGELAVYLIAHSDNHLILFHRAWRGPAFEANRAPINPANAHALLKSMEPLRICRAESPGCR